MIFDPKVKGDLNKNVKKEVTPPKPEPKRRIISISKVSQSLATKTKGSSTKRKKTKGTKNSLPKRIRRKLVVTPDEEEEDEEETESNDLRRLKIVPRLPPMTIDCVCEKIRDSGSIEGFKNIDYDSLNKDDQEKIEKVITDMVIKFRYTPLELGEDIPKDLYNKLDAKW